MLRRQEEPKGGWGKRKNAYYDGNDYEVSVSILPGVSDHTGSLMHRHHPGAFISSLSATRQAY